MISRQEVELTYLKNSFKKKSSSDPQLTQIRKKLDDEYKNMETGKKLTVNHGDDINTYLPPITYLYEFLGLKLNLVTMKDKLEKLGAEPLEISRTGLYDLQNKGVGIRTHKKLTDWGLNTFGSLMGSFTEGMDDNIDLSYKTNSNAFTWLLMLKTIKASVAASEDQIRPEYHFFLEFLQQRCNGQIHLLKITNKLTESQQSEALENSDIWWKEYAKPLWSENSAVSLTFLDSLDSAMADKNYPNSLDEKDKNTLYINIFLLNYDFLFSAIAHFEVGIIMTHCTEDEDISSRVGAVGNAITNFISDKEGRTCFYYLLEAIKVLMSETNPDMSWRKLASYIDIDEVDSFQELLNDKQYNYLKDWRKGKNLPSTKSLLQFCNNIGGEHFQDILFIYCRIAIGLDNIQAELIVKLLKEKIEENDAELIWKEVLSHYHKDYYLYYLNQLSNV